MNATPVRKYKLVDYGQRIRDESPWMIRNFAHRKTRVLEVQGTDLEARTSTYASFSGNLVHRKTPGGN